MRWRPRLAFDPERELTELRQYLGEAYDGSLTSRWYELVAEEFAVAPGAESFYRNSQAYLYDLTVFAMTETKLPYLRDLMRFVHPPARVLDMGCGIGSDGLLLLEAGYEVAFADFANPSVEFLRWRLEHRGQKAEIYDLDDRALPDGFDAVYAFDVIEHVPEPVAFLRELERLARFTCVNFLEDKGADNPLHRELPIGRMLNHAQRRGLMRYRCYPGGSHLVIYEPGAAPALIRRVHGRLHLARGKMSRFPLPSPRRRRRLARLAERIEAERGARGALGDPAPPIA